MGNSKHCTCSHLAGRHELVSVNRQRVLLACQEPGCDCKRFVERTHAE